MGFFDVFKRSRKEINRSNQEQGKAGEEFDPTTYDWSNIFSQPDLSNYALLSDIPTNNPIDTSSFVTQDQLANLLASLNASSNQPNNNNFSSNTTDIIPLGSYSLLNR